MRILVCLIAVGCGGSGSPAVDAAATLQQCAAAFVVDRTCTTAADCVLLTHPDCCGPIEIGVATAGQAAAGSAETTFGACEAAACGARGCAHADQAEDGTTPMQGQTIVPTCTNHVCGSTVQ